jgi:erythromycin esterase-like protein
MRDAAIVEIVHRHDGEVTAAPEWEEEIERPSHYFSARLPEQFDLLVHVDRTRALERLEKWARHEVDLPATYPTGV